MKVCIKNSHLKGVDMPIITTKAIKAESNSEDSRIIAGEKQERDVAFYLRRAFKDSEEIHVFNDFTFTYNGEKAQIDHLVLHKYGFLILESKSIYGEVKVNESGEWSRSYKGYWSGIPSPIKQAELQQQLLKKALVDNAPKFLGKMLGVQQNVGGRRWDSLCVVSNSCILHRDNIPADINERIIKSEAVADAVRRIGEKGKLKAFLATEPFFTKEELHSITEYLLDELCSNRSVDNSGSLHKEQENEMLVRNEVDSKKIRCKKCGEAEQLTACHGKFGYFVRCLCCDTNTSMRTPCAHCGSKRAKVTKKKLEYWLKCECSESYLVFVQKERVES